MAAFDWLFAAAAFTGHMSLCVAIFNRLHAVGMHRKPRRFLESALVAGFVGGIVWYSWTWFYTGAGPIAALTSRHPLALFNYGNLCLLAAIAAIPFWLLPKITYRPPRNLLAQESRVVNVADEIGMIDRPGLQARLFSIIPGNQILHLDVSRKRLAINALPAPFEGFSITHLSDLHFTGEIGQPYFDYVIDQANALQSDVIIISGDIIESTKCETWIEQTLARLQSRLGIYFVLGNHDKRMVNVSRIRQMLKGVGMQDIGGTARLVSWDNYPVLIAGNELPWFPTVDDREIERVTEQAKPQLRLLVSHSPDQIRWAQRRNFHLMLAGHNHGGQVCLPWLGPLVAPSLYGTRYAGGVYYAAPTLLHVSRGISGEHPLRLNCPPEITRLELATGSSPL